MEGYLLWPARLRDARIARHQQKRAGLERLAKLGPDAQASRQAIPQALLLERLFRYPDTPQQVAPTLLGNAIRRFEYYAQDRYWLDSQRLWYHLSAVVPESMAKQADNARAGVDFFVCLVYALAALTATSVAALIVDSGSWVRLGITGCLSAAAAVASYRAAVVATDNWAAAVRAMADLGRLPLAAAYGLVLPAELQDERTMWRALGWLLTFPYSDSVAKQVNQYRQPTSASSSPGSGPPP